MTDNIRYSKKIAIVDSNNFYVSCERIFSPELRKVPVVVLSNNDGCVIARSQKVKRLGIPVGAPVFKYKELIEKHNIVVRSSNYELYGDISHRIVEILRKHFQEVEVYSVDECFIDLTNFRVPPTKSPHTDYELFLKKVRNDILQWTGVPVSIGIGNSKTLAKVANKIVKSSPKLRAKGVLDISVPKDNPSGAKEDYQKLYLSKLEVGDVWGIGGRLSKQLKKYGINTALDFVNSDPFFIRKKWSVTLQRTQLELDGYSCIHVNAIPKPRQMIMSTRSFGKSITKLDELEAAITSHTHRISEKLRRFSLVAGEVSVFIRTNKHSSEPQVRLQNSNLITPYSNHTQTITQTSLELLRKIYSPDFAYAKSGVIIGRIQPANGRQMSITHENLSNFDLEKDRRKTKLDLATDIINARWGSGTLKLASGRTKSPWKGKSDYRSPAYTTNWNELLVVN